MYYRPVCSVLRPSSMLKVCCTAIVVCVKLNVSKVTHDEWLLLTHLPGSKTLLSFISCEISGSHSGVVEDEVLWDVTLCRQVISGS